MKWSGLVFTVTLRLSSNKVLPTMMERIAEMYPEGAPLAILLICPQISVDYFYSESFI